MNGIPADIAWMTLAIAATRARSLEHALPTEPALRMGKMAHILQARGQLDEALRIRKEEELPVYERLGDVRGRAFVQAKIGLQLLDAGDAAADEARRLLETAWADLSRMGLPEADVIAEAMRGRGLKRPAP